MFGLLTGKRMNLWTGIFLTFTVLTSVTGFGFPFDRLLPSHKHPVFNIPRYGDFGSLLVSPLGRLAKPVRN